LVIFISHDNNPGFLGVMPQNEEAQLVRKKYGLALATDNNNIAKNSKNKLSKNEETRNYDRERTILLGALEKITKFFQKQMAQGDFALDNDSRFVEEFCTIIELCIQHGWKSKIKIMLLIPDFL
jgi:monomeric isocitrate dehydrogenase